MGSNIEQRLNWQVVDLSASVASLHDASVLFIAGDQELSFSQQDQDKLRQFVEEGGTIVGNADCDSSNFVKSFLKLGSQLFPCYEFRELPDTSPILKDEQFPTSKWKTRPRIMALSNGVRELMVLPGHDLSRAFQARTHLAHPEPYELLDDIVLYAVDKKGLREKGVSFIISDDPKLPIERRVRLARLEYGGNWDPEPAGWPRLAALLHNQFKVGLTTERVKLGEGKLKFSLDSSGCQLAHLTGTTAFTLSGPQREELSAFIAAGGTLVIDAAGGAAGFAGSADDLLQALLPATTGAGAARTPLPPESPLYKLPQAAIPTVSYRPFARKTLVGKLNQPRVIGVEKNGRICAFFSREDLSAGLVGEQIDGIIGYAPEDATAIMRNIVLYGLAHQ